MTKLLGLGSKNVLFGRFLFIYYYNIFLGFGFVPMTTQCHQFWCNYLVKKGGKKEKGAASLDNIPPMITSQNYLLKLVIAIIY
jgi:hypothetical protein